MKRLRGLAVCSVLAFVLAMFGPAPVAQAAPEIEGNYMPGEVIVTYTADMPAAAVTAKAQTLAESVGAEVVKAVDGSALLRFAADADVPAMVELVKSFSDVAAAEPNYIYAIPELAAAEDYHFTEVRLQTGGGAIGRSQEPSEYTTIPLDQLAAMKDVRMVDGKAVSVPQWPLEQSISWHFWTSDNYLVWPDAAAGPGVCVVDTGADVAHPDLVGRVVNGYDFVYMDGVADDENGHGTHVAGIITAKINSGSDSAIGMSRSKVYAVKALDYRGIGTSFDLAAGIKWCGGNPYVKVINLSWGGYNASYTIYNALYYAIKQKGKYVAAAAGNDDTTTKFYPAAFGSPSTPSPSGSIGYPVNAISTMMDAVGASTPSVVYVDANNDGSTEAYYDCKASFSNYGTWVELLAPGESIYSTLPVSYPFYLHWYLNYANSYDRMSGTSMASPIVAAAAARAWSAFPSYTNNQISSRLWSWSRMPNIAEDPDNTFPSGARKFCWPNNMQSSSSFISFAGVMGRGGVYAGAYNAANGMPVRGASMRAVNPSGVVKDIGITDSAGITYLINLPFTNATGPAYKLQVSKAGYTTGYTTYLSGVIVPLATIVYSTRYVVPMAQTKYWAITTGWSLPIDLDNHIYTPAASPDPGYYDFNSGLLGDRPYIRGFMDGGSGGNPSLSATVIRPRTGTPYPWYYSYGSYTILIYNHSGNNVNFNNSDPVVRVWYGGLVKKIIIKDDICAAGENAWLAGTIRTTVTEIDNCGANMAPYAVDISTYSTAEADK